MLSFWLAKATQLLEEHSIVCGWQGTEGGSQTLWLFSRCLVSLFVASFACLIPLSISGSSGHLRFVLPGACSTLGFVEVQRPLKHYWVSSLTVEVSRHNYVFVNSSELVFHGAQVHVKQ